MLNKGIGLVLLCLTSHAFSANVVVTTTEDSVKADDQCSLREAIDYINKGLPEAGLNGCGGKEASSIIVLSNKEYRLNSQIKISQSLNIKTNYEASLTDNVLGRNNAVIKMAGNDRIFYIERSAPDSSDVNDQPIDVALNEVTLQGCDAATCADQGGLIYNKERLKIQYSQLLGGKAREGGAVYNAGIYVANKSLSFVSIANSIMQNNIAEQGAVIYSEILQYDISRSVIRDNSAKGAGAALFYARDAYTEEVVNALASYTGGISNSTIFNNSGYVVRVMDGMIINNITMILNKMGLIVDAPFKKAVVANSVLAKNGTEDCKIMAGGSPELLTNNLYSIGCEGTQSQALGTANLIASSTSEGQCDIASDGILCPFKLYDGVALGYFRPRLLATYKNLSDSLIVNKGPALQSIIRKCNADDQRGLKRPAQDELCDRGAVELKVDRQSTKLIGEDLLFGGIAKMTIADQLVDGELISPEQCQQLFGNEPNGKLWQAGCMKLVQNGTPSKGTTTISQNGEVVYTPNGDWDGADIFKIFVVTTTTRFNDSANPYIEIPVQIVQRPPNDFQDYKVNVSGGSYGFGGLLILVGLIGLRRLKK